MLTAVRAPLRLSYLQEHAIVEVDWDTSVLPSVLLWISDRFLAGDPWNGSYRGLGVEPVAAAFDLPAAVSAASNPMAGRGVATAVDLEPGAPLRVDYSIRASARTGNV